MNQRYVSRSLSGVLLLAALSALYSAPAHAQQDAARATPPPGRALVFVFRQDREPLAAQVPVVLNAESIGELTNSTFVMATVSPGRTFLRIGDRILSTLSFMAEANRSYFVRVDAVYNESLVRTDVAFVDEVEGRRAIAQSRLAGPPKAPAPAPVAAPAAVAPVAKKPSEPATAQPAAAQPAAAQPAAAQPAAAQPSAAQKATPVSVAPERDWEFALIATGGTFKLSDGSQVIAGFQSTYDTTSKSVFGVEAEFRNKSGLAIGGEVFSYTNDLVTTGSSPNAEQKVLALMANAKYYFRASDSFYPFVGAGIGVATTDYGGGLTGNTTSFAYQGMVGLEYRFKPIGIYVQYKYLGSKWVTGDTGREVKVGGDGILAGISYTF